MTATIVPLTLHDAQHAIAELQAAIQKLLDGLNAEVARGQEFLDYNTGGPLMYISVLENFREKYGHLKVELDMMDVAVEGIVETLRAMSTQLDTVTKQRDLLMPPDDEDDPNKEG